MASSSSTRRPSRFSMTVFWSGERSLALRIMPQNPDCSMTDCILGLQQGFVTPKPGSEGVGRVAAEAAGLAFGTMRRRSEPPEFGQPTRRRHDPEKKMMGHSRPILFTEFP